MDMDKIIGVIFCAIFAFFVFILIYAFFVYLPVAFYAESECLSKGYPRTHVTFGLDRYCSNLDGAVTVKVVKQ